MDISPLWISARISVTSTVIVFFAGIGAAWLVAKFRGKTKGLIDSILTLPMVLPPTVVGFLLLVLCGKNGPVGQLLRAMGTQIIFTWWAAVIAAAIVSFPMMYKTTRAAFEQIDTNIINAARTLGAPEWKVFWKVAVPVSWPGIISGTILAFARALGEFGATLMVAGNIPGKTQTIPIAIYYSVERGDMHNALNWVILIFMISLVVMTAMNYWLDNQSKHRVAGIK
jgi:molybdate transport system permease protein